jgi:phospholipid N-methyltransferase
LTPAEQIASIRVKEELPVPPTKSQPSAPLRAISSLAVFGSALLSNAGSVGAAVPSSPALARRIAGFIPRPVDGLVIELGAGTGAVTEGLLKDGIPANRLIPIELSEPMARHLRKQFTGVHVLCGDASKLRHLLARHLPHDAPPVAHIVSSLPLRSLPVRVVARIAREIFHLLPPNGRLIQFTYSLGSARFRPLNDFQRVASANVWMNLPPARVDVYQKP